MRLLISLAGVAVVAAGCVTAGLTPKDAAPLAFRSLGQDANLYWVEAAGSALSRAMVQAVLPADAPVVQSLRNAVQPASTRPVSLAVAGSDSAYTALVVQKALGATAGDLPQLHLVFIGSPAHETDVRAAVEAKNGRFTFEAAPFHS